MARSPRPAIPAHIDGRQRVVVESIWPRVDDGPFAIKRVVGDTVTVKADVFADGHDLVAAVILFRGPRDRAWREAPMAALGNDRYEGTFSVGEMGTHAYSVCGWIDAFGTWRRGLGRKLDAGVDIAIDLRVGAGLVRDAATRARGTDLRRLTALAMALVADEATAHRAAAVFEVEVAELVGRYPDRSHATVVEPFLPLWVDRERAGFSAWYELFPRSLGGPNHHGTLADVEAHLDHVAGMGFDVLYLPPIHPIGRTKRKGPNNAVDAQPGDLGSPWAIGATEGGHDAVHPDLGTVDDVARLAAAARSRGIDLALDLALQCAPDHPWVVAHPQWFRHRPDGTVQFAENPPKRYEDIYPIDFDSSDWKALWKALYEVVQFWIAQGIRVFRVDNPHTKAFAFWEWLIAEVHRDTPEVLFLSEAFTRPKVMNRLAKIGFSQSYTYFTWRTSKWELTEYFTELTRSDQSEYFRPNPWPNTPDILPEHLQTGGRAAFAARLVLAATLSSNYGIYGPAFELAEGRPREKGSEEYLDSEKYQLREWDLERPDSLRDLITRINRARRENVSLQANASLVFHPTDNEFLICFSKRSSDGSNVVLVVANLDPHHIQGGWVGLSLGELGVEGPFTVHDLLGGERYVWEGARNFVQLNPDVLPAHVFRVESTIDASGLPA
jgi:starch synthase (maltosyl-transferring)